MLALCAAVPKAPAPASAPAPSALPATTIATTTATATATAPPACAANRPLNLRQFDRQRCETPACAAAAEALLQQPRPLDSPFLFLPQPPCDGILGDLTAALQSQAREAQVF